MNYDSDSGHEAAPATSKKRKAPPQTITKSMVKRPLSAYMYFVREERPKLSAANPEAKFVDLGRMLGAKWKTLNAAMRAPYQVQADADKARYVAEKASAPPDDENTVQKKKKGKKVKAKREGPKRPLSAYMFFSMKFREQMKQSGTDMSVTDIMRAAGARWRELTDEEKQPFNRLNEDAKVKYEKALADFQKTKAAAAAAAAASEESESDEESEESESESDESD